MFRINKYNTTNPILFLESNFTALESNLSVVILEGKSKYGTTNYYYILPFSALSTQYICKWWINGQNKISEKVIYLKTCLIQKESTVSPWRFLKIGNVP